MMWEQLRQKHFNLKELFFWLTLVCIVFGILRRPMQSFLEMPESITAVKLVFITELYLIGSEPSEEEIIQFTKKTHSDVVLFVIAFALIFGSWITHITLALYFFFVFIPNFYRKYIKNE